MRLLRWLAESAEKMPPEVWPTFIALMCMLILNYYFDGIAVF